MSRILRCLVCLVLICCILINCSPIRAKAVAVEASIAIGLIAMMILASAGVVYTASTTNQIHAIGNSFQTHMYQWGTSAEKLDEVDAFFNGLHLYDPGSGDDDETPHEKQVRLARGILAGLTAWVASLALGNIEIEEDVSDSSWISSAASLTINGSTYVVESSDAEFLPFVFRRHYSMNTMVMRGINFGVLCSSDKLVIQPKPSNVYECPSGYVYLIDFYNSWNNSNYWDSFNYSGFYDLGTFEQTDEEFRDFIASLDFSLYGNAVTEPILPNTYVGDIPEQLQSGELEPEDIPLPDINLEPYIEDGKLAPQKVIDTMSNLSTGALPYDQFLQQSTLPPEIDDGGTDTDSGTSSDTWHPPSNPGQFALDLTKYFPFCIPFDLYDLFTCLNADPVAPVIHWELPMPGGSTYPIELDLSPFNSVAQLLRRMQLLLFCVGLAIKTRDLIKG